MDGRKLLSDFKLNSSYLKWSEEKNRRETWEEACDRVFDMHKKKYKSTYENNEKFREYLDFSLDAYKDKEILASMRSLQFGGESILKHQGRIYNCLSGYCDRPIFFQECMYWLLCGCGVGFSVQTKHIEKLPMIQKRTKRTQTFVIPDTIEGWSDAIGVLLSSYMTGDVPFPQFQGKTVHFDYSEIRPAGAYISGGFKAAGSDGLRKALIKIEDLLESQLKSESPTKIRPIVAYDVVMHMSDAVLSGGVRRSATICLFSPEDEEMLKAKTGDWFVKNPQRARSNNSVLLIRDKTSKEDFAKIMKSVKDWGEPAFVWSESEDIVYNPCLSEDAYILTNEGLKQVKDLIGKDFIAKVNGKDYKCVSNGFFETGDKGLFKLNTKEGYSLELTSNHKVLLTDGRWIEAGDLKQGDKIVVHNHENNSWEGEGSYEDGYNSTETIDSLDITKYSSEYYLGFIKKLFISNGGITYSGLKLDKFSKVELEKIQLLLNATGLYNVISKQDSNYVINLNDANRIDKKTTEDNFYATFESLEYIGIRKVYDCTIDDVHAFDANGLYVHNCVEIGMYPQTEEGESGWQGCVSYDTPIITKEGIVNIGEAVENSQEISIWNGKEWKKVKPFQTGENRVLYRVEFSDGSYLDCTENHKFLAKNRFQKEFKEYTTEDLMKSLENSKYQMHVPTTSVEYDGGVSVENAYEIFTSSNDGVDEMFNLDKKSIEDFIKDYFSIQSTLEHEEPTRVVDSKNNIRKMQLLLTKYGYNSKIGVYMPPKEKGGDLSEIWYIDLLKDSEPQYIKSITKLDGLHNSYCLEEPETHNCLFANVLTKQCNLVEINGASCEDEEDFYRRCKAAAIVGTLQAGYTDFVYVEDSSKVVFDREALLGCSITGMMNKPEICFDPEIQKKGAKIIREVNKEVAEMIGINQAARTTCVKPSGNASVTLGCASGIHGEHSKRYFRNVQMNKDDDVAKYFVERNPAATEDSVWSANKTDWVISFPIESQEGSKYKKDLLGVKQLEYVKLTQQNWVEHGTNKELCMHPMVRHNVSNTISVDDWDSVEDFIYNNRKWLAGVSLLSSSGDRDFAQAPFTSVYTPQEILEMYGDASVFASGLIVDGLQAFYNNLWDACDQILGRGKHNLEQKTASNALMRDWIRRAEQFAERYFDGDVKKMTYCLKDVYNYHKWVEISREMTDIDWTKNKIKPDYVSVDTLGAIACSGGKCEIQF